MECCLCWVLAAAWGALRRDCQPSCQPRNPTFVLPACCSVGCQGDLWAIVMDAGTPFSSQLYQVSPDAFLPKDWIMDKWEHGYYITAVAGEGGRMVML